MKMLINAWLVWRAMKANKTGLVAAAIAVNGGWRAALKAVLIVWLVRGLLTAGVIAMMLLGSAYH